MTKYTIRFLTSASTIDKLAAACNLHPVSFARQTHSAHRLLEKLFYVPHRSGQGMLLADEVGLGKTTVGALVALVASRHGDGRSVRILAPNPTVAQRWRDELKRLVDGLQTVRPLLIKDTNIRGQAQRLHPGHVHVTTHGQALQRNQVRGDLLIVDEAHRSKHAESEFRKAVVQASKTSSQLLFLTATPMSTRPKDMADLLAVLGGKHVASAAQALGDQIVKLYDPSDELSEEERTEQLQQAAQQALKVLPDYVVRHTVDDLKPEERTVFGRGRTSWSIPVPHATPEELALLVRADRILRLAYPRGTRFNDPQYHVAREPLRQALADARRALRNSRRWDVAAPHFDALEQTGVLDTVHPKMVALAEALHQPLADNNKVVVFCHHHLVAAELTRVLHDTLLPYPSSAIDPVVWRDALRQVIQPPTLDDAASATQRKNAVLMRDNFIDWTCSPSFRNQIGSWLVGKRTDSVARLVALLEKAKAPRSHQRTSVAEALQALFNEVTKSTARSTSEIFRRLNQRRERGEVTLESLPFGSSKGTARILGACHAEAGSGPAHVYLRETRPELLMALFNSPFGPDVLVLTDRYSEGIDLHKACRLLVHYELDPSAMRTVQRNGRVRRVGGLAGAVAKPVAYAMPAFGGTRDERLVDIMHGRLKNFGLLLGAVRDINDSDLDADVDERAQRILDKAKPTLAALSKAMTCPH
jgi:ERCC4-related helicase